MIRLRRGPAAHPGRRAAPAERDVAARVARSMSKVSGSVNLRGSRLAAALSSITVVPAGRSTPPTVTGHFDSRKSPLIGLSKRSVSSMKLGIRSRVGAQLRCRSGSSAISIAAALSRRTVVSWPAANRLAATRTTSMTSGAVPSGKVAEASRSARRRGARAAVLDVVGELARRGTPAASGRSSRRSCCRRRRPLVGAAARRGTRRGRPRARRAGRR